MNNQKNVSTVVVTVIDYKENREIMKPVYEAYGEEGFNKFVVWYEANLSMFRHAIIEGFEYNNPNAIARVVVTK
jgi:hypothetical protein